MKFNVPEEHKNASGVYKISNSLDSRVYIGSTVDLSERFKYHHTHLYRGDHTNALMQEHAQEHSDDDMEFSVLEYCDKSLLQEREIYHIKEHKAVYAGFGFNVSTNRLGIDVHKCDTKLNLNIMPAIKQKLNDPAFDYEAQFCPACKAWLNKIKRQMRDLEEFSFYYEYELKQAKKRIAELEAQSGDGA